MASTNVLNSSRQAEYRKLPAVDALLRTPELALLVAEMDDAAVTAAARAALADARRAISAGRTAPTPDLWPQLVAQHLEEIAAPSLRPVLNATGVIIHTNLGRAPLLSAAALAAMQRHRPPATATWSTT
jgi:L-seryl-tRNA(Ser) seleniumtransferase